MANRGKRHFVLQGNIDQALEALHNRLAENKFVELIAAGDFEYGIDLKDLTVLEENRLITPAALANIIAQVYENTDANQVAIIEQQTFAHPIEMYIVKAEQMQNQRASGFFAQKRNQQRYTHKAQVVDEEELQEANSQESDNDLGYESDNDSMPVRSRSLG